MNAPESAKLYDPGLESTRERADLLASSGDDAPKTQIIAIYGKGGTEIKREHPWLHQV